jgi:acetyl esterase
MPATSELPPSLEPLARGIVRALGAMQRGLQARLDPRAAPLGAADLAGAPPAYRAVAGFHPLRDEPLAYAERPREAGVPVELRLHRGLVHGFAGAVGLGRGGPAAVREIAAAIRAGLDGDG